MKGLDDRAVWLPVLIAAIVQFIIIKVGGHYDWPSSWRVGVGVALPSAIVIILAMRLSKNNEP